MSTVSYRVTLDFMAEWWSIEVFDSRIQAALRWKDSYRAQIVEAAADYANGEPRRTAGLARGR